MALPIGFHAMDLARGMGYAGAVPSGVWTMLTIPGGSVRTCEGWTRRDWLRVGGLGLAGCGSLSLPGLWRGRASASQAVTRARGFGRAKSCIVLFMFGAPAHQDTFDLKPDAPAEVRGEFRPIATSVAGIQITEHLPQLAQLADRYTLIRSVTHPDNTHTVAMHYMLSGVRHKRPETNPQNAADDFPCYGAVAQWHAEQLATLQVRESRGARPPDAVPAAVSLNAPANQVSANNHIFPGFFAGFLGSRHDPLFVAQHANQPNFEPLPLLDSPRRMVARGTLLRSVEREIRQLEQTGAVSRFAAHHQRAYDLLTSAATRRALDVAREPSELRDRYGKTPFGQGCLLARRLVESGVHLVTVNWERDDAYWDTHANNFKLHKDPLLPNLDRGFSALLTDLEQRGLLDETLIVWLAEFGRTPAINAQAGRDHWAPCNTVLLAGAGLKVGQVYGASDRQAAYPLHSPVRPEDLSATIYHLLGIDPRTVLYTPQGQPRMLSDGDVLSELL